MTKIYKIFTNDFPLIGIIKIVKDKKYYCY